MEEDWNMGMRFAPTDEELVKEYLWIRLNNGTIHPGIIKELNIYDYEPWQLQSLAFNYGMYFFTPIRKKHSGGSRIDRLTKEGYWRASQSSSMVLDRNGNQIGTKRPLVYYVNDGTQKGIKTNWLMNEYMLIDQSHNLVICWIHQKKSKENDRRDYYGISSCSNVNTSNQINLILSDNLDYSIPISDHNLSQEVEVNLMTNDYPNHECHSYTIENLLGEERIVPMTNDCPKPDDYTCTIEDLLDEERVVPMMNDYPNLDNHSCTIEDLFDEGMDNLVVEIEDLLEEDMDNLIDEIYPNHNDHTNTMEDLFDEDMDNLMAEIYSNHNGQTYTIEDLLE